MHICSGMHPYEGKHALKRCILQSHMHLFERKFAEKEHATPPHKDSVHDRFFTIHDSPRFGRLLFVILTVSKAKLTRTSKGKQL
jgi:hypothetical protein